MITFYIYRRQGITYKKLAEQNKKIDHQNEMLQSQNHLLQEVNHEKNTLMSIVAHDLKSPFNRIAGFSTLVKLEGPLNTAQESHLQKLNEVTQSGVGLITDLLDLDNLTDDKEGPSSEQFDLSKLLKDHLESFRALANSKGIHLTSIIPPQLTFTTDRSDLSRIVDNLLSNAIKFSESNKTVTISAALEKSNAIIHIKDEGPGFSDEDKKSLYKKFAKLSARPTRSESSNGLGLAIVRTLIDRLHGTITLKSEKNVGSEFTVVLPSLVNNAEKTHINPVP
jgi:signal transduction histidine kinase